MPICVTWIFPNVNSHAFSLFPNFINIYTYNFMYLSINAAMPLQRKDVSLTIAFHVPICLLFPDHYLIQN